MDLVFNSHELTQVGSTPRRGLIVLPSAKNKHQKICVGDDTGSVTCFTAKKGNFELVFKSNPGEREVTALTLGGTKELKDKIYVAFGQTIQGLKKKGKDFFRFNTSLTEDIHNMLVEDVHIWTAGEYVFNMFDNCRESQFFMSPDRINHMLIDTITGPNDYNTILACQDRSVRILQGADVAYECHVDGAVSALSHYRPSSSGFGADEKADAANPNFKQIIYGTENGLVGQLLVDTNANAIRKGWVLSNHEKRGSVTSMTSADITKDGVPDVVVGRDDGSFEVYGFDMGSEPARQYLREFNESITAVDYGYLLSLERNELVLSTYSGKVMALSYEPNATHPIETSTLSAAPSSSSSSSSPSSSEGGGMLAKLTSLLERKEEKKEEETKERGEVVSNRVREMRAELDRLREKVAVQQEKYQKLSSEMIAVQNQFKIRSSLRLLAEEACYLVTLEIQHPIDVVVLHSNVDVMLLDHTSNLAIVSKSPADPRNGHELLATYRCQETTNRVDFKFRTLEGRLGELNAYVVPKLPPKTCQKATFQIKPLSLHEKVNEMKIDRAMSTLRISGEFSLNEIHQWVCACLPEVPPRLSVDEASFTFRSTFLDTFLICQYSGGQGIFRSDNVSTISIMKEIISREATSRKTVINIALEISDDSINSFLQTLRPKLDVHFSLARKQSLIEPLKEIQMAEGDVSFLSPEYLEIINNSEDIEQQHKNAPRHLDFLRGIVTDLLVDSFKLRGKSVQNRVQQLLQVLDKTYSFESVLSVFGLNAAR